MATPISFTSMLGADRVMSFDDMEPHPYASIVRRASLLILTQTPEQLIHAAMLGDGGRERLRLAISNVEAYEANALESLSEAGAAKARLSMALGAMDEGAQGAVGLGLHDGASAA